jgi:hypothetical protein
MVKFVSASSFDAGKVPCYYELRRPERPRRLAWPGDRPFTEVSVRIYNDLEEVGGM